MCYQLFFLFPIFNILYFILNLIYIYLVTHKHLRVKEIEIYGGVLVNYKFT